MDQNDPVAPGSEGGGPVITTDPERAPAPRAAGVVPSFLAELTRAMQAAAERQREEIATVIDDDAAGQVEIARKRGAAEAGELRRAAERDVDGIQAWAAQETERIRREASQRTDKRRKELEAHLTKHESIIDSEVVGVGVAVKDYRSTAGRLLRSAPRGRQSGRARSACGIAPAAAGPGAVRGVARADAVATFANTPEDADNVAEDAAEERTEVAAEAAAEDAVARVAEAGADDSTTETVEPAAGEAEPVVADATKSPADTTSPASQRMSPPATSPGSPSWIPMLSGELRICPASPSWKPWRSPPSTRPRQPGSSDGRPWVADRDPEDHGTQGS